MSQEGVGIKASVKYARLIKWENDEQGNPMKDKPPLEICEKFSDEAPFVTTFRREDHGSD